MNIKGLKIDKKLASKLYSSLDNISVQNLHGIEAFVNFSWSGFSKEEFKNLLSLFLILNERGAFDSIVDNHTFVFNYSTDITEMDIVTVLQNETEPFLLDIESKNGDDDQDLIYKIKKQIKNRKKEFLPQLLGEKNYISVGFVNNQFVCGYFKKGKNISEILSLDEFVNLVKPLKEFKNIEEFLVQTSNLASIVKLCTDIQKGEYNFYEDTNKIYDDLIEKLETDDAYIIYGNAGTGKSVLALKLFFERKDTKILLMNSKLFYAFDFYQYYKHGSGTFNVQYFKDNVDESTVSIIDESQRLSFNDIVEIIQKSRFTFLFGDHKQACFKNNILETGSKLKEKLVKDFGFKVSFKQLKKSRRYNDEVNKSLEFLTSDTRNKLEAKLPSDYEIDVYYDEKKFLDVYDKTDGIKKIYTTVSFLDSKLFIGEKVFTKATYSDDSFSIWSGHEDYFGITYHALSFDIDHCFVVLKNTKIIRFSSKQYIFKENYSGEITHDEICRFTNELNVLFTRGRKSLRILAEDIETYLFLNTLIKKLKNK